VRDGRSTIAGAWLRPRPFGDNSGKTPLHVASQLGRPEVCSADLLELGFDVNSCDNQGRTPLHVAQEGCEDVALLLLEPWHRPRHSG